MEKSATFQTRVAKTLAGALIGAVVGYGAIHLAGFGGATLFAFFGAVLGAGIALGVPGAKDDQFAETDDSSAFELDNFMREASDRTVGRGIYVDDDN